MPVKRAKKKKRVKARAVRRKILISVLEAIGDIPGTAADLFTVYLEAGYGASFSRLQYLTRKKEQARARRGELQKERRKFTKFMYELKRCGLVTEKENAGEHYPAWTEKGKKELERLYFERVDYHGTPSLKYTIVVFDVPQIEQKKRRWIRDALRNMGFVMVQRSVWVGKITLPEDFIEDVFRWKMEEYVHVFEALSDGTLEWKCEAGN